MSGDQCNGNSATDRSTIGSIVAVDPLERVTQGTQHKGPMDGIGQLRLPIIFRLADVAANIPQGTPSASTSREAPMTLDVKAMRTILRVKDILSVAYFS